MVPSRCKRSDAKSLLRGGHKQRAWCADLGFSIRRQTGSLATRFDAVNGQQTVHNADLRFLRVRICGIHSS